MGEIGQDMADYNSKITLSQVTMEEILKKLQKASDEGSSVERLRDEARERVIAGGARARQIDQEIIQQFNAAVAAAQAGTGMYIPLSMFDRADFFPPFAAEVHAINDRITRDVNLINMHDFNIGKFNEEIRALKKEYGELLGKHEVLVQTYKKLEQLTAEGKEKIEGWKQKQEL